MTENQLFLNISVTNDLIQKLFSDLPCSVFWKDLNGTYLGVNAYMAQISGINDPDIFVGKTDFDMPWLYDESVGYRADDKEVMEKGTAKLNIVESQTVKIRRKVHTNKSPLRDSNNNIMGVFGVTFETGNIGLKDFVFPFLNSVNASKTNQPQDHNKLNDFLKEYYPNGTYFYVSGSRIPITLKELECLILLDQGKMIKVCAAEIGICPTTFQFHIQKIKQKTGLNSKADLIELFRDQMIKLG